MILRLLILFISSLTVGALTAHAEQLIITGRDTELARVSASLGKNYAVEPVFNTTEKALLKTIGKSDLSLSLIVQPIKKGAPGDARSIDTIRLKLKKSKIHVKVESDLRVKLKSTPVGTDPLIKELWGIKNNEGVHKLYLDNFTSIAVKGVKGEDVNLPSLSNEGRGMVVALLDSGFDTEHPDLKGQFVEKKGECENLIKYQECLATADRKGDPKTVCNSFLKLDTDGNGYPMDCHGWNFIGKKSKIHNQYGDPILTEVIPEKSTGHGTKVAGIVAAASNNSIGVRGIAPKAKILGVKVTQEPPGSEAQGVASEEETQSLISSVVRGMVYAIGEKANVINLSLGWNGRADSTFMRDIVKTAQDQGIIVVAAAANDSTDALVYPCQYEGVVCVASHDPDGKLSEFSNFGSGVDIAAPGFSILSTCQMDQDPFFYTDGQGYDFDNGTSFAAPYTAGALAVLRSQGLTVQESIARLLVGARKRNYSEGKVTLAGNLDVKGALSATPQPYITPVNKGIYPVIWDRKTNTADLSIDLKNIWKTAATTSATLTLSERDKTLSQIKLNSSKFKIQNWKSGETKTLDTQILITDPRVTSDATLVLEISSDGFPIEKIRIQLQISVVLEKSSLLPNAIRLPIRGTVNPNAVVFTIQSMDGKPEQDYVTYELADDAWKIQILRETQDSTGNYYSAGPIKSITAPKDGSPRTVQRLDVNLDGKPDYVFTSFLPGEEEDKIPYFQMDYRDANGEEVIPSYLFKNRSTVLTLDRFQWIRAGSRLVPIWTGAGITPTSEKSTKYDPWNPTASDDEDSEPRIYYHDPATSDGVRSIALPVNPLLTKDCVVLGLLSQSTSQRINGKVSVLITQTDNYVSNVFVGEISSLNDPMKMLTVEMPNYRNFRSVESPKTFTLDPASTSAASSFSGNSGLNSQKISSLIRTGDHYLVLEQRITPLAPTETVYKTISSFVDTSTRFTGAFGQGNYDLLYGDSTTNKILSTSLRRYTYLPTALYELSFLGAVAESGGVRLPAIQIPDGFGAYPGAEVITPVRWGGTSIELTRPAALRIQMASEDCDWLAKMEPNSLNPAQAVYFCGDQMIRIPYRF